MGRKLIDMTGKKVGRLTVLEYMGNEMWRCRCDCGNEIVRRGATLRKNARQSCGCWAAEISKENGRTNKVNLVGQKIGKLLIIDKIDNSGKEEIFKCRCECGNYITVKRRYLVEGSKTHCGCENSIDITGLKFGRLTAISRSGKSNNGSMQWSCKCDCGNTKIVDGYLLRTGSVRSCGCLHAEKMHNVKKKYNDFVIKDGIVNVKLSNSEKIMLCDIDDWERLKQFCWRIGKNGYACTNRKCGNEEMMFFHHSVIECADGFVRDHINRNKLDNRKINLRMVTAKDNSLNQGLRKNNTSGYRGVHYSKRYKKYIAQIMNDGKCYCLGKFDNIEDAIEARINAEIKYFGKIVSDLE